jgi:hypothetical protein
LCKPQGLDLAEENEAELDVLAVALKKTLNASDLVGYKHFPSSSSRHLLDNHFKLTFLLFEYQREQPYFFTNMSPSTIEAFVSPNETPKHEEYQYLDLVRDCLEKGEHRPDR